MDSSSAKSLTGSEKETAPRRLAFSVENILDPTKFNGKHNPHHHHNNNNSISVNNNNSSNQNNNSNNLHSASSNNKFWSGFDRDDKLEDDQSDSRSGNLTASFPSFVVFFTKKNQSQNTPGWIEMRLNYTRFSLFLCHPPLLKTDLHRLSKAKSCPIDLYCSSES